MFTGKKTVDGILAALTKTIEDLKAVAVSSRAEGEAKNDQAAQLLTESKAAHAEADRATTIADNLSGMIQLETFKR